AAHLAAHGLPADLSAIGPAARVEAAIAATGEPAQPGAWPLVVTVPRDGYAVIRLDMGAITAGFVDFDLTAPAGTIVEFHYTEERAGKPGPFGAHGGNRYIARGGDDVHRVFDKKGFRFAYLLIHGGAGAVRLNRFSVEEHLYPDSGEANFSSSD